MGMLESIWIKKSPGGPMVSVSDAEAKADSGLVGSADQGGKRQVTVIDRAAFEALSRELGIPVDPVVRRANLMVSGIDLEETKGKILRIGELKLLIKGETRGCERMDAALPGLRKALARDWRGGVYGIVLNDCSLKLGDRVTWDPSG